MSDYELHLGDCTKVLKTYSDDSFDSCITDPPYELGFMGKDWDSTSIAYNVDMWKEVLRVLKPGAHLLAFSSTRTYHRMACAIEDAGFEIRDQIGWLYGSGMPKSLNVSKALDKLAGVEPIRTGRRRSAADGTIAHKNGSDKQSAGWARPWMDLPDEEKNSLWETMPNTDAAKQWEGWGTALKPAWEPICIARKPLECDTVAENILEYGTGAINIDACRIEAEGVSLARNNALGGNGWANHSGGKNTAAVREEQGLPAQGRWPANVIHDGSDEVLAEFAKYGDKKAGGSRTGNELSDKSKNTYGGGWGKCSFDTHSDSGTAARFFYSSKASQFERNENGDNEHPTVKPISLMTYLVKLVTPPGGIVLDPFAGSGSTGVAALRNKFRFVGIELIESHFDIALARVIDAARAAAGLPKQLTGQLTDYQDSPLFAQVEEAA